MELYIYILESTEVIEENNNEFLYIITIKNKY